ncbi:MAG: hypothetical protein QXL96_10180 [Ignisphaera sp.]
MKINFKKIYQILILFFLPVSIAIISYRHLITNPGFIGYNFEFYLPPFNELIKENLKTILNGYTYFQFGIPLLVQDYFRIWSYIEYLVANIISAEYLGFFYIFLIHIIAFLSSYLLIRGIDRIFKLISKGADGPLRTLVYALPSIYYAFSPFVFNHISAGHIYVSIAYAFFPLLLNELIAFSNLIVTKPYLSIKNIIRQSLKLAIVLILIGSKINYLFLAFITVTLWYLLLFLDAKDRKLKVLKASLLYLVIAFVLTLGFHNYVILYVENIKQSSNIVKEITSVELDIVFKYRESSPLNYLGMKYNVPTFDSNLVRFNILQPYTIIMILIIIIGFIGLMSRFSKASMREKTIISYFMTLYVVALGFVQAATLYPFKEIISATEAFFGVFRELYHWMVIVILINTVFLYWALALSLSVFYEGKRKHIPLSVKFTKLIALSIVISAIFISLFSFAVSGNASRIYTISIPQELKMHINKMSTDNEWYRVLWLPPILNIRFDALPVDGVDPLIVYSPKPSFGNWLPMNNYAIFLIKYLYGLNKFIYSRDPKNLTLYSQFLGIKYVIYRESFHSEVLDKFINNTLSKLNTSCYTEYRGNETIVYKCKYYGLVYIPQQIVLAANLFEHTSFVNSVDKENSSITYIFARDLIKSGINLNAILDILRKLHPIVLFYPEDVYDFLPAYNYVELGTYASYYDPTEGWSSAFETTRLLNPYLSNLVEYFAETSAKGAKIAIPMNLRKGTILLLKVLKTPASGQIAVSIGSKEYLLNLRDDTYTLAWYAINISNDCDKIFIRNIDGNNVVVSLLALKGDINEGIEYFLKKLYGEPMLIKSKNIWIVNWSTDHISLYISFELPKEIEISLIRALSLSLLNRNSNISKLLDLAQRQNISVYSRLEFISTKGVIGSYYFDIYQKYLNYVNYNINRKVIWISPLSVYYDKRSDIINFSSEKHVNKIYLVIDFFTNKTQYNNLSKLLTYIENNKTYLLNDILIEIWNSSIPLNSTMVRYSVKQTGYTTWNIELEFLNNSSSNIIPIVMTTNFDRNWVVNGRIRSLHYEPIVLHFSSFGFSNMFFLIYNSSKSLIRDKNLTIVIEYRLSRDVAISNITSLAIILSAIAYYACTEIFWRFIRKHDPNKCK